MHVDVAIFGGSVAGLWLLHELAERNYSVVLLESGELGQGQTIASQGILHGGVKYAMQGLLPVARNSGEIAQIWSECLAGKRAPNLEHVRLRAPYCYLWRGESVTSRLGMFGAKLNMQVKPHTLPPRQIPGVLRGCPGSVAQVDEPVISPSSLLAVLAGSHCDRILKIDAEHGLRFQIKGPGQVRQIRLINPQTDEALTLQPRMVVFTAGAGNKQLLKLAELPYNEAPRQLLHMTMLRGNLPVLNGHCVDGSNTRVTVTTDTDAAGETIWQVGGQVSEEGVMMQPPQLLNRVREELESVIPGLDLSQIEGATYRIDRATGKIRLHKGSEAGKPNGNVLAPWPRRLALAPQVALDVLKQLPEPKHEPSALPMFWPRPSIAQPPWETVDYWWPLRGTSLLVKAG